MQKPEKPCQSGGCGVSSGDSKADDFIASGDEDEENDSDNIC